MWSVSSQASIINEGIKFSVFVDNIELKSNSPLRTDELSGFGVWDSIGTPF